MLKNIQTFFILNFLFNNFFMYYSRKVSANLKFAMFTGPCDFLKIAKIDDFLELKKC